MKTLDLEQAANMLFLNPNTLQAMAKDGKVPGAKIGRAWVFHEEVLDEYLRAEIDRQVKKRRGAANDDAGSVDDHPTSPVITHRVRPRRDKRPLPVLPEA